MIGIIIILCFALAVAIIITPLARIAALRTGVVSMPRSRDIHIAPVPMLGGAAIYMAFVAALLFFGDRTYVREVIGIFVGATLISLFGLADDRWELPAHIKIGGQLLAGIVLLIGGTQVNLFPYDWMNWLLTLVWVVGITNAVNFLDNMDGLSSGVATIAASFFLLLAAMNDPRQVLVGAMAAALIGACLGFLRYNFNPASIFMGDTGSLFLGFILASLGIKLRFLSNTPLVTWMVPVCVLALPIFDTTLVVISRLRRGVNPFTTPGKDHISHRLVALGMNRREAVLSCYLIGGAAGMIGTFMTTAHPDEAYIVAGGLIGAILVGVAWLEYVCPSGKVRQKRPDGDGG